MYWPISGAMRYSAETTGMRAFCEDEDRYFLERLREGQGRFGVALHAYVLMTNHVIRLMTPRDTAGISRLMQHLGRHYVLYINRQYRRTGTLWEGCYKASLAQSAETSSLRVCGT